VIENLISIVDDDESVRRTTTLLIESFGFRAAAFESAETFLNSGHLRDTSCLIVDVQMPGMDGLQLQSHLTAAGCGVPIIFIPHTRAKIPVSERCKREQPLSWASLLATSNFSKSFVQPCISLAGTIARED
jgi:FixJ family two-component response regulator